MNIRKPSRQRQSMQLQGSEMKPVAKLGTDVKAKIGQQLREMYDEIVEQGVPDRFAQIMSGLDDPNDESSKNDPAYKYPRGHAGCGSELARVRHFIVRKCRSFRRPRAGSAAPSVGESRVFRARNQYVGMVIHHSAQSVPLRISQAPARSRGR